MATMTTDRIKICQCIWFYFFIQSFEYVWDNNDVFCKNIIFQLIKFLDTFIKLNKHIHTVTFTHIYEHNRITDEIKLKSFFIICVRKT